MTEKHGLTVKVYKNIMSSHEEWTGKIRALLAKNKIVMVNIIGSPGCGKTALLEAILPRLMEKNKCMVLEGDVETDRDARRLAAKNIPAHQIVTQGACHLSAQTIWNVINDLDLAGLCYIFVENVGNLVCPAEFDIGEECKIAVLSVTEGEDKPLKYPLLFRDSKAAILTKTDLLPYLDVNSGLYLENIANVNSALTVFPVSAKTGEGTADVLKWLQALAETLAKEA